MRVGRCIGGFALACLLAGCGDDDGASGESGTGVVTSGDGSSTGVVMNTAPTVQAQADVAAACAVAGATRAELHATRVGCIDPPPAPCTLPEVPRVTVGDGVDCPAADSPQVLRVELTQTGRYHVEVVSLGGDEELSAVCFGVGGEVEVLIDDAELMTNPTIAVSVLDGSACG